MAIKKSELYSSLWAGCDELRGSMDASQYKDYVLVMLFMKYVSDRKDPLVEIPADVEKTGILTTPRRFKLTTSRRSKLTTPRRSKLTT